jgi:hypothetical protein
MFQKRRHQKMVEGFIWLSWYNGYVEWSKCKESSPMAMLVGNGQKIWKLNINLYRWSSFW